MREFISHLLLPRESNNHRAKLLHHQSLLIFITFLFAVSFFISTVHHQYPSVLGISANISIQDLLNLTNQQRQQNGLVPLQLDNELIQAAEAKGHDMFAKNYWAHISPDGTTPWYFIKNSGYDYLYAGENLARGFTTASDTITAWMNSPSHRENVLSPNYTDVGFAVLTGNLTGDETVLVVEEFGKRYLARNAPDLVPASSVAQTVPSPTSAIIALSVISPTLIISPTPILSPTLIPVVSKSPVEVAAIKNTPLVDSKSFTKQITFGIVFLILAVLALDAIIVERKKIVRVVSHNIDHIIFLVILLIALFIITRGVIL